LDRHLPGEAEHLPHCIQAAYIGTVGQEYLEQPLGVEASAGWGCRSL
jgi:hypothetical protein